MTQVKQHFAMVPIHQLNIADNVRRDPGEIVELVDSIRRYGILEPLVGCANPDGKTIDVLMGQRRLAAAREAGLTDVPVILRPRPPERDRVLMQLAENLDRADMSPIDEALAFKALMGHRMTQAQIAKAIRKSPTYVSFRMQCLAMPEVVRVALDVGWITIGDALAVPRMLWDDKAAVKRLAKVVRGGGAAVRSWANDEVRRLESSGTKAPRERYIQARPVNLGVKFHDQAAKAARSRGVTIRQYLEDLITAAGKKR